MVSPYPGRAYEGTLVPNMLALALGREAIAWATLLTDFTRCDTVPLSFLPPPLPACLPSLLAPMELANEPLSMP